MYAGRGETSIFFKRSTVTKFDFFPARIKTGVVQKLDFKKKGVKGEKKGEKKLKKQDKKKIRKKKKEKERNRNKE